MSHVARVYHEYFTAFSNTTAIRGFALVKHSKTTVEKWFWAILMICFTGFTVNDVLRTFQNFNFEPTSSRFSVMRNLTISLRDPTICIYMDPAGFWRDINISDLRQVEQLLDKFSSNKDILQMLSDTDKMPLYKADALQRPDLLNISVTNSSALRSFLSLTAMMLSNVVRAEQTLSFGNASTQSQWGLFNLKSRSLRRDTSASLAAVKDFYVRRRVPLQELIKLTCSLMCRQMNLKIVTYRQNFLMGTRSYEIHQLCRPANCYWFGTFSLIQRDMMCLKLYDDTVFQFTNAYDLNMIVAAPYEAYMVNYTLEFLSAALYLGFGANFGTRNFELIKHFFEEQKYLEASIIGNYKAVNIKRKKCADITYFECYSVCRSEYIRQQCGCIALGTFAMSSLPQNDTGCGEKLSSSNETTGIWGLSAQKCANLSRNLHPNPSCSQECYEECETLIMSQTVGETKIEDFLKNFTVLQIAVAKYVYPYMEEFVSVTLRELVVGLGGNLSLYLGASFIALVHILVFFSKIPLQQLMRCRQAEGKAPAKRTVSVHFDDVRRYQTEGFAQPLHFPS